MPPSKHISKGPDTIRVLLTTDNHVGYKETDPIIGNDSWKTFHEITEIAKAEDVDMILQGGDLFHVNEPSKKSMFHVIKSIRENCLGDRPCEIELLSDPVTSLDNRGFTVNYEDANVNISTPIFAISGNHDDATGDELLSPLDVLSATGLVNQFGRIENNEDIKISPLLFRKGASKLALYGMANIRDERLHRGFREGIVKFFRPASDTEDWFNILAFHQNHAEHSRTSHIPESFLPSFFNFILWGHEHECFTHPVFNPEMGFDVLQAGSSVATSLSEGELAPKHVFILSVKGKNYSLEPIRLKSVRPFVMKDIQLSKFNLRPGEASKMDLVRLLIQQVEELIEEARASYTDTLKEGSVANTPSQEGIPLPLVRLKVEYSGGYELENSRRFSNRFVEKVANVYDVVQFYKRRDKISTIPSAKFNDNAGIVEATASDIRLQDIVGEFLNQTKLSLLPESGIIDAVNKYVENDDKQVIDLYVKNEIERETEHLLKLDINSGALNENEEETSSKVLKKLLERLKSDNGSIVADTEDNTNKRKRSAMRKTTSTVVSDSNSDSDLEMITEEKSPKTKRTSRNWKGSFKDADSGMPGSDIDIVNSDDSYTEPNFSPKSSKSSIRKRMKLTETTKSKPKVENRATSSRRKSKQDFKDKPNTGQENLLDSIMSMGNK